MEMGRAYYVFPNYTVWVPTPTLGEDQPRAVGRGHKIKERALERLAELSSAPCAVSAGAPVRSFR
jgi:hypothetical protein